MVGNSFWRNSSTISDTLMLARKFDYNAYKFFLMKFGYAKYSFDYLFM